MALTKDIANGTSCCLGDERPPVHKYAPSIWVDVFSNSSFDEQEQQKYAEAIEALKQEVRGMLMAATTPLKQMTLIDTLERLGLAYHFETEIEHKLRQISNQEPDLDVPAECDLFTTALRFRMLRQHRHRVSCNVFDKFVNKYGVFEEGVCSDVEGILSLYEAAHVRFPDEKLLEEAADFTRHWLKVQMEGELESSIKEKVKRALEQPLHRSIPIVYARLFISIYENSPSRDELLLKLAKFNFNFMQNLYREELFQLTRWWNKFDLKSKLPYARDRLVEAYFWGVGYRYEPQYSCVRVGLAKSVQIIGVMDDTYDNYATLNEAQLFTQILHRWNTDEIDILPEYMRILYRFILSTYEDYERDAVKLEKSFAASYFKETVQQLGRAYNQELKWVMQRQMPSFQEYAKNSEITSCIYILFATIIPAFTCLNQETIDWMKSEPKLAISSGMIGRYWDDVGTHQRESKGGKMLTSLDCYMKQHGVTKEETLSKFEGLVEELWKDVNEEWVSTTFVPKEITMQILSYARNIMANYDKNNGRRLLRSSIWQERCYRSVH